MARLRLLRDLSYDDSHRLDRLKLVGLLAACLVIVYAVDGGLFRAAFLGLAAVAATMLIIFERINHALWREVWDGAADSDDPIFTLTWLEYMHTKPRSNVATVRAWMDAHPDWPHTDIGVPADRFGTDAEPPEVRAFAEAVFNPPTEA